MLTPPTSLATPQVTALLQAADRAARRVPPAFPLDATVAVNPFLGQTGEDMAEAAARLARVAGSDIVPARRLHAGALAAHKITAQDLQDALDAASFADKPADIETLRARLAQPAAAPSPLPTLADLAAGATGTDWPEIVARTTGLWAAGHFDRGQALWTPAPGRSAFAAWREWAQHDLTPELAGLSGFCRHVAACPDTPERAILRASAALGIAGPAAETLFHRLLVDLGGWAQHARYLLWQAELSGSTDATLTDLLAIRLVFEEALLLTFADRVSQDWRGVLAAHTEAPRPTADQIADAILQDAAERAFQRRLAARLQAPEKNAKTERPALQAAFCIDVRSEVFRRALESQDAGIRTLGFAGFFGLPVAHHPHGSVESEAHLPVLLTPGMTSTAQLEPQAETAGRITARARRAWNRFRQAAVSSFAFVEAAGPLYAAKLLRDALSLAPAHHHAHHHGCAPRLDPALTARQKAETAATVLKAMSMTQGHARLVLLLGHGASTTNNPQESAYHCGACGGHTGEVSARLLAQLLNDPETRTGLAEMGLPVAADTLFVAGLHDTTTDEVTLFAKDAPSEEHAADLAFAREKLAEAGRLARIERATRLPGASHDRLALRARNWAETRPEWGLAGCSAFIAAPRGVTAGADLGGRVFLHSYDWRADEGMKVLELILTAPVVVASWISLQYYGSTVAPELFGGGNKLLHNVVGGIGVVEGNGGRLRAGLPLQAVSDGARLMHEPLRLSVLVEAPREAVHDILSRHEGLRALFDKGWMHLLLLEDGKVSARYRPGLAFETVTLPLQEAA
ncbi:YbcC family protein [Stappia sp. 28M-7]|uniref:YbcC family protein n=1 Tax=Stappia sp. 28M-7 TaxID=2762596 RepID=UPI00163CD89E|nr:DUF2309 domain-containing protein [Stappia sp. 28M-7]MBC2858540.1 DUF2309 domain-containing protein [Stappia sp. 28M-7]